MLDYRLIFSTTFLALCSVASSANVLTVVANPDSTEMNRDNGGASLSFWATQSGNVITTGFANNLANGGFIGHDILDPILESHTGGFGYVGGSMGWEKVWTSKPFKGSDLALCGSMGSEALYDVRWTSDMFELLWYGNGGHTGRVDVFSGTGVRAGVFNRFGLGLESSKTKQRLEVSVVQRLVGVEWSIPYGYLWLSEDADSLASYLQTEGRLHANIDSTDSGNPSIGFLPSYGIGISGTMPLASETLPIRFEINFKDVGLLFENDGSSVAWFQEGFSTTGLPLYGDSLTIESISNGDIAPDSLLLTGSSVKRMTLLPSSLSAEFVYEPSEKFMFKMSVKSGGWMPELLYSAGIGWIPSDRIALGMEGLYGGWGGWRSSVWAKLRYSNRRILVVQIESPLGLFFNKEVSNNTYGRGVTFRLERIASKR
jgi:hypothetical protein